MNKTQTLGLCMIVKNEEYYLPQCLDSVKDIVDEIIIVDTGSTDQTPVIAAQYHAKLYHYEWDNNFSHARNFSISKSSCDWLLLLDADERLAETSKDKLLSLIESTTLDGFDLTICNYTGLHPSNDTITHQAFRLLRNNKHYTYTGNIHEQITPISKEMPILLSAVDDIIIYHYGYLDSTIAAKDKRNRNIPLIESQLQLDPNNAFYLYTLGNEYMANHNFEQALATYTHSLKYADTAQGFTPNLYFRMIACLLSLNQPAEARTLCEETLKLFPNFTDILYLKGGTYIAENKITLAIDTFNQCLLWGEAPARLRFQKGSGTFLPLITLGDLYTQAYDYTHALQSFTKAIEINPTLCHLLYKIGKLLVKLNLTPSEVSFTLAQYFDSLTTPLNLAVFIDILLSIHFYTDAESYLKQLAALSTNQSDLNFLKGKYDFYTQQFTSAATHFLTFLTLDAPSIFAESHQYALHYLFLLTLMSPNELDPLTILEKIKSCTTLSKKIQETYELIYHAGIKQDLVHLQSPQFLSNILENFDFPTLNLCLKDLIYLKKFDLVDLLKKFYHILRPDTDLLCLAAIYAELELYPECKNCLLNAIKQDMSLNHEAAILLDHCIECNRFKR